MYDADYCFTLFNFRGYGSNNDCGMLANSLLGKGVESNKIHLPTDEPEFSLLPYCLLGGDIFPLKKWFIKQYSGKNLSEKQKIGIWHLCI